MARSGKVTIYDIARHLGVSDTTVSLVLSGQGRRYRISQDTIRQVEQAARELGYRPSLLARQLAGKRSNVVGVLINTEAIADVRLIQAMEMLAAERDLRFIVGHAVNTHGQVKAYLDDFEARGVDAVISIFHSHPDYSEAVLAELDRFELVVFFEQPSSSFGRETCYVEPDYDEIGRLSVQHLIDRGRSRIGLLFSDLVFPYAVKRLAGCRAVLENTSCGYQDGMVWVLNERTGSHWADPFTPELARLVVKDLVVDKEADAIVAVNDLYAARLLAAMRDLGLRVPDDVAIVGCDNLELGTLVDPPLTTLWCDIDLQARHVMGMLFELLDNGTVPEDRRAVIVPPELIVRASG